MADVKISALPQYSGSNPDLRWFIMNNSGETTTFKYSGYSSPLRYGNTANSIISQNLTPDKVKGPFDIMIGDTSNVINSTTGNNIILHGVSNTLGVGSSNDSIISSQSSATDAASYSSIIGSNNSTINGVNLLLAASVTNLLLGANTTAMVGGTNSTIWFTTDSFVGGGNSHYVAPYTGSIRLGFLGGYNNEIGVASSDSVMLGGSNHFIRNTSPRAAIVGGDANIIDSAEESFIAGGSSSTISAGTNNAIIAGLSSNIIGYNNVVMLGTSGTTATRSDASFVQNLVIANYSSLDFSGDTAAAAGGVVLGQVYHDNGALRIRIV